MSGARVRIRLDGEVLFSGSVKEWATKPPELFKDTIKPETRSEPWQKGALVAMADAVMLEQSVNIDVTTLKNGWTMTVTER